MSIEIKQVATHRELNQFIYLPWLIYSKDSHWVPPLIAEEKKHLNPDYHPFYKHSEVRLYLARKNSQPVGRIATIINHNHNKFHNDRVGFFGFFECANDKEVARRLFDQASQFLKEQDMDTMRGPMSFSTNEQCGLLIEGFEHPPYFMMPYNHPYYLELIENYGFHKAQDLFAYYMHKSNYDPRLDAIAAGVERRIPIRIRAVERKQIERDIEIIRGIYNSAWEKNWGFVPMTELEFNHIAQAFKKVVDPRLCLIGEIEGKPAGFLLAVPNLNVLLKKVNGRLFPFGFFIFLFGLKKIKQVRIITMGVLKEFRNKGVDLLFYQRSFSEGTKMGIEEGEFSWILEDNETMNRIIQQIGGRLYKKYRIYDYPLT